MVREIKDKNLFQLIRQSAREIGKRNLVAYGLMATLVLVVSSIAMFGDKLLTPLLPKHNSHALSNPAVTQPVQMVEQANLPQPQNVKVYGDDRMATVTWDRPSNTTGIVGYIVVYGKTSDGALTLSKQTIHTTTQIQPLENGVEYTVQVRSVKGRLVDRAEDGVTEQSTFAVADGPVSPPVTVKLTPSSARVNAMRARLTGFFDDFNQPQGAFDELKWNHATTACEAPGKGGQFINNQFHAHNMTSSMCDRDGNVSRPRAILDIAGRNEANPAQIEMDVDGIGQPRDVWYIDLIPLSARKNGMPVDVTGHNSSGDDDNEDPGNMIRINQGWDDIRIVYYDANRNPTPLNIIHSGMPCGDPNSWPGPTATSPDRCDMNVKTPGFSPLAQPTFRSNRSHPWIANVRRHWVVQFSRERIKLFIDGTLVADTPTPTGIVNDTKFVVHSTLFSYNTGKQFDTVRPTISMLHWDNFGFTGPLSGPSNIITHNYIDGSPTGSYPLISTGTVGHEIPNESRNTKINIPDAIGSPIGQARLMFTIQPLCCRGDYHWSSADHVMVNGKKYNFPDPRLNFGASPPPVTAGAYIAHSTGLYIDPADLKTGMNDLALNIDSGIWNVHIELDYDKNNAPAYTQPKDIFGAALFNSVIQPAMTPNDDYWFVEQYMGLANVIPNNSTPTPVPSTATSVPPTPTQSGPTPTPSRTPTPVPPTPTRTPTPSATPTQTPPTPTRTPAQKADFNNSGKVDIQDLSFLLSKWGTNDTTSDLNNDGKTNTLDLSILLSNWEL